MCTGDGGGIIGAICYYHALAPTPALATQAPTPAPKMQAPSPALTSQAPTSAPRPAIKKLFGDNESTTINLLAYKGDRETIKSADRISNSIPDTITGLRCFQRSGGIVVSVPQMTQDARRQVTDELGCCEYDVNFASVFFLWGAVSFPLANQRTKELTPHFVCVDIITSVYVHAPCSDKFSSWIGCKPVVGRM